jgi:hypothetical protein
MGAEVMGATLKSGVSREKFPQVPAARKSASVQHNPSTPTGDSTVFINFYYLLPIWQDKSLAMVFLYF